jgi:hypothetical protein
MILVEASWEDQSGTMQNTRARIENKSSGGVCIRVNKRIAVGTRLRIEGQWEKFSGEARYCRRDGREYLVGIQKDKTEWPAAQRLVGKMEPLKENSVLLDVEAMARTREREPRERTESSRDDNLFEDEPKTRRADEIVAAAMPARETGRESWSRERRRSGVQGNGLEGQGEAGEERKHMRRKWFDMGHKAEKQEESNEIVNEKAEMAKRVPTASVPAERFTDAQEGEPVAQLELLSMEDIYRVSGIVSPRKGYSINKIVEMLYSEHLRGLSKELKRASVLMALDAAGISVEEVLEDAKARQEAINSYEAEQRKQFEAQLARKAEENVQIQAEMERVKARYTERLRRNLDGMAREKATFGNWLTLKQQESQSMAEAIELCLKAPAPEKPSTPLDEVSLAGARVKPV